MSDLCANQSVSGLRSGGDAPRQFDLCTGKDKATSCAFRMASRSLIYRKNGNNIDIWNNTFSRPWRLARRCAPDRPPTHRSLRPGAERPPAAARRRRPSRRAAPPSGLALLRHLFDTSGSIAAAIVVPEAQSRWGQKLVSYRPLAAIDGIHRAGPYFVLGFPSRDYAYAPSTAGSRDAAYASPTTSANPGEGTGAEARAAWTAFAAD